MPTPSTPKAPWLAVPLLLGGASAALLVAATALASVEMGVGAFPLILAGLWFGVGAFYAARRRWALAGELPPRRRAAWVGGLFFLLAPFVVVVALIGVVLIGLAFTRS